MSPVLEGVTLHVIKRKSDGYYYHYRSNDKLVFKATPSGAYHNTLNNVNMVAKHIRMLSPSIELEIVTRKVKGQ